MKFCKKIYNVFFLFSLNYLTSKNFGSINNSTDDQFKQQYKKQESLDDSTINSKNIDQSLTDDEVSTKDESSDNHSDQSIDDQGKSVESSSIIISPSAKQSQGRFSGFKRVFSQSFSKVKDQLNKAGNFVVNNKNLSLLTQKISHSDFYKTAQANIKKTQALMAKNPKTASALGVVTIVGVTVSGVHSKRKQKRILKEFENAMVKSPEQKDKIIHSAIENKKQQLEKFNDFNILLHHIGQGTPVKPNDILLQDQCQWKHNWSFLKGYLNDSIETIDGQNYQVRLVKKTIAIENVVSLMAATYETEITKYLDDLMKNGEAVKIIGDHQQQTESFKQSVDSITLTLSSNGQNSGSNQKPNAPNPLKTPSQKSQNAPSSSQQSPGAGKNNSSQQIPVADAKQSPGGDATTPFNKNTGVGIPSQQIPVATTTSTPGGAGANTTSKPEGADANTTSTQNPGVGIPSQKSPGGDATTTFNKKTGNSSNYKAQTPSQRSPVADAKQSPGATNQNRGSSSQPSPVADAKQRPFVASSSQQIPVAAGHAPKKTPSGQKPFEQKQTARFPSQKKQSSKEQPVKPINFLSNESSSGFLELPWNSFLVNFNISSNQSSGSRKVSDTKLSVSRSNNNNMFGVHPRSHKKTASVRSYSQSPIAGVRYRGQNRTAGRFSSPESRIAGGLYNSQSLTPAVAYPPQNRTAGGLSNPQSLSPGSQSYSNNNAKQFSLSQNKASSIINFTQKSSDSSVQLRQQKSENSQQQPQQQQKISDQELFYIQGIKMDTSYALYDALQQKSSSSLDKDKIREQISQDQSLLQQAEYVLKNIFYQQINSSIDFYLAEQMKSLKNHNSGNISLRPIKKYLKAEFTENFKKYFESKKYDLILKAINEALKKQKKKSAKNLLKDLSNRTVFFPVLIEFLIKNTELIDFSNFKDCFEIEMKKEYSFATYVSDGNNKINIIKKIKEQVKEDFIKEANLNIKVQDSMKTKYSTLINKLAEYITKEKAFPVPIVNKSQASIEDFNHFYYKENRKVILNSTNVIKEILRLNFKDIIVDFISDTLLETTDILDKNYIHNFKAKEVKQTEVIKILREMKKTQKNKNDNFQDISDIITNNNEIYRYNLIDFLNFYEIITNKNSYIKTNQKSDPHGHDHRQHESHSYTRAKSTQKSSHSQTNEKDKKKISQSPTKTPNSGIPAKHQLIEQNLTSPLHTQEAPETGNGSAKTPVKVSAVTQSTGSGTTPGFTAKEARPISQKIQLRQSEVKTSVGAVQETVRTLSKLQSRQRQIISHNKSSILPQSLMIPTPAEPTSIQTTGETAVFVIDMTSKIRQTQNLPLAQELSQTTNQLYQQHTFGPFQQTKTQQASLTTYQKPTTLSNQTVTTASTTTPLHQPLTGLSNNKSTSNNIINNSIKTASTRAQSIRNKSSNKQVSKNTSKIYQSTSNNIANKKR